LEMIASEPENVRLQCILWSRRLK